MDITEFVAARLAEDEAAARAADERAPGPWVGAHRQVTSEPPDREIRVVASTEHAVVSHHVERWEPARVLREVAAKRAILGEHAPSYPAVARQEPPGPATVADPDGITSTFPYCATCDQDSPCATLAHLAAVWSGHPDYRAEWKP